MEELEIQKRLYEKLFACLTPNKQELFERIVKDRTRHVTVAVEDIYQEHNASAVMRTCECLGIQDLHVIEKRNEYVVQRDIARGSGRWMNLFHYNHTEDNSKTCIDALRAKGYRILATSPHAENDIYSVDLQQPMAFFFGTEGQGISQTVIDNADELIKIPMVGFTESFNISVSVAITLSAVRKRLIDSDLDWNISKEEQLEIKINWCKRMLNGGEFMAKHFLKEILEEQKN